MAILAGGMEEKMSNPGCEDAISAVKVCRIQLQMLPGLLSVIRHCRASIRSSPRWDHKYQICSRFKIRDGPT